MKLEMFCLLSFDRGNYFEGRSPIFGRTPCRLCHYLIVSTVRPIKYCRRQPELQRTELKFVRGKATRVTKDGTKVCPGADNQSYKGRNPSLSGGRQPDLQRTELKFVQRPATRVTKDGTKVCPGEGNQSY